MSCGPTTQPAFISLIFSGEQNSFSFLFQIFSNSCAKFRPHRKNGDEKDSGHFVPHRSSSFKFKLIPVWWIRNKLFWIRIQILLIKTRQIPDQDPFRIQCQLRFLFESGVVFAKKIRLISSHNISFLRYYELYPYV